MQFWDIAVEAILKNILAVFLLFVPFVFLVLHRNKLVFREKKPPELSLVLAFCVMSYSCSVACVTLTGDGPTSQNTLYFEAFSPELSVNRLGLFTTIRLDVEKLASGALEEALLERFYAESEPDNEAEAGNTGSSDVAGGTDGTGGADPSGGTPGGANPSGEIPGGTSAGEDIPVGQGDVPDAGKDGSDPEGEGPAVPVKPYNVMDIDFETLMASGQNDPLYPLHKYFSSVEPTRPMSIQGCSRAAT